MMTRPGLVLKTLDQNLRWSGRRDDRGWGGGSMTRGGRAGGSGGRSNGERGVETGDMTRKGLNPPKPMMTRVCKPPQKKKSKKKFSGSNFFFKKKIFAGLGGFCHHGFFI